MKQFLRSLCTLLLLMMWCSVGFAQTTIWSEDWTGCKSSSLPKNINSNYSSKNNGTQIYASAKDNYAGGTAPELLIKKGDALVVKVTDLKGCSGTFTLNYSSNKPSSTLVVSANGSTIDVSSPTNKKYTGTFNIKEGTTEIELKFSASDNARIDDIKLTGTPAESKPTLTFSETEKTVYKGSESNFTMPTLVLKDKDGKEVTTGVDYLYEITDANPEGCLDVDMITGKITFNELGTANIKVTTSTTDSGSEFNNLTASYILNYKKIETTLTLSKTSVSVNLGETPELPTCTLKAGDEILTNKALSYTITPEGIANINATTGELTLISAGKATVNVSFIGDETYEASNIASYDLTVVDPNAPLDNIVFDAATKGFNDIKLSKQYPGTEETATFKAENGKTYPFTYSNCMRYNDSNYNPDVIQMRSNSKGKGSFTSPVFDEMPNGYKVNVYYGISEGNKPLTITSNEETSAESISNTYGDKDIKNGKGYCTSIILTNGSSFTVNVGGSACYVSKIEIIPLSTPITLDENAVNTDTKIAKNNGKTLDVALTRTLVAKKWNTFCVPFETEIAGTALEGATVKTIGTVVGNVINLEDATKIEAGVPYLVMPTTESIVNPTFKSVTISVTTPIVKGNDDYKFVGTYSPKTINEGEFGTIWGVTAEGKLAKINAKTTMKGLRAYFVFPTSAAAAKLNFDGETTGINNIETNATVNGKVYNLNGQYVGNSLNGLKKGIYVVNGKKVIK